MALAGKAYMDNTYKRFITEPQGLCGEILDINEDI